MFNIIIATDLINGIGKDNKLPWNFNYDMLIQIWTGSQSIELENSILNEMIKIQMSDLNSIKYSFVNHFILIS